MPRKSRERAMVPSGFTRSGTPRKSLQQRGDFIQFGRPFYHDSCASTRIMASSVAAKMPPSERPEALWTRTKVISSFWVVILLFGIPMWWRTTSIYRAELPFQEMLQWADGQVCSSSPDPSFELTWNSRLVNQLFPSRSGSQPRLCPVQMPDA